MRVVLGIPFWGEDPQRVRNYEYVFEEMRKAYPFYGVVAGNQGLVGRGRQRNHVARQALKADADVVVICDADTIVEPEGLHTAIARVHSEGGLVYPYNSYEYLTEKATKSWISGGWTKNPETTMSGPGSYGGCFVMRPGDYADIGGMIELDGWGFEDIVFSIQARLLLKPLEWAHGRLIHLFHHSEAVPMTDSYKENIAICKEFELVFEHTEWTSQVRSLIGYMNKHSHLFPEEWMKA